MKHESGIAAAIPSGYRAPGLRVDIVMALVLAGLLSACWAIADWANIGRLILPDGDDMMRLAQVRDWLRGQAFNDWTQYRLAPPLGAPMHWSRINDFGIAGLILALTPFVGRHGAELGAVIAYPALLLACSIFLSCRIARQLWGAGAAPVTAVLAVLAYPGTMLFLPGRIDHHALQIVVIEVILLALMQRPTRTSGAVAGLAAGISLMIGLETAPQVAALVAALGLSWVISGMRERQRLFAFAGALAATTALFLATMRPTYWSNVLCDAFTPASSSGTLAVATALAVLAAATPCLKGWASRLIAGGILGGIAIGATLMTFPACLHGPYAVMAPFLRDALLPHIDEANGILSQASFARGLAIAGLLTAGCAASVWMVVRRPGLWLPALPLLAVIAASALIMFAQARGTYIGAPAATPVLAGLILAARRRIAWRAPAMVGAWIVSAGVAYAEIPAIAAWFGGADPAVAMPAAPQTSCNTGDVWTQVDRYPPGVAMTSANTASYLIGATRLSAIGALYHRNNRGNMAVYRYFLGRPERSAAIARAWNVTYVAFCPGDFAEIDVMRAYPHSLAAMLQSDRPPAGFERLPLRGARLRLYRVRH